ncbi:MAG: phosphatidylserine decarboxylase family protein [Luteibaculum sp.]
MKLHREGNGILTVVILLATCISAAFFFLIAQWSFWLYLVLQLALLIFLYLVIRFFRVPKRNSPNKENILYAPCDGKVVVIEETTESEYFNEKRLQISIFMSPLNVHVNYYPCDGEVLYTKYHPGKYLVAWHPKSSTENERSTIVLNTSKGVPVLLRQIAGAVARRIVTYSQPKEQVKGGSELGFIKFGSRVDLFVPTTSKVLVDLNQKTVGSETPLVQLV